MRWTGHQLLLLWSRPCVPHYVLWGMHLGRTTGLRGEHCHNLQNTARCPPSQYSNCASSNGDRIYQPIFWAVQNNLNGWPASKMLVSLRHTQQGWVGSYEKILSIKTIILGTIMATKASATFIICRVLPGSAKHPADQTGNCHIGRTGWRNGSSLPTSLATPHRKIIIILLHAIFSRA